MRKTRLLTAMGLGLLSAPLFGQSEPPAAREPVVGAVRTVDIVLDNKNFVPIDLYHDGGEVVPVSWRGCKAADIMSKLKKARPGYITREPKYQGSQQLYGYMTLGNRKKKRYYFALDVIAPDNMLLYFDFKNDGRLDEAPPLKKEGSFKRGENGFATLIEMPWDQLIEDSPYHGKFLIWFILNSFQWANSGFSHSSHSELKGKAIVGGVPYTVIIADSAANDNDGDLTNDGLYLKRGKEKPRYISDDEAKNGALIDGKRYRFRIRYASGGGAGGT